MRLTDSVKACGTPEFAEVFKREVEALGGEGLPLQQGLTQSSYALPESVTVTIDDVSGTAERIRVRAGLFYSGIIAGCSCADDPTPIDEVTEYCRVRFDIDRLTARTSVELIED